jgi:CheY-like chemotaxis protein
VERPADRRANFRAFLEARATMTNPSFMAVNLLIVDDNRNMRTLLRTVLRAIGIKQIHEAADGNSGYAELLRCKPDIVITDLSMQGADGIEFTRKVRLSRDSPDPFVPILMVTGHTERARIEAARDAGVTEFLAKPITVQSLLDRLIKIVERPRPFVRSEAYFGPDRRRRRSDSGAAPRRRRDDRAETVEIE